MTAPPDGWLERRTYRLVLRAEPGCRVPDGVALRLLLKVLLRSYGLRCLGVWDVDGEADGAGDEAHE